MRKTGRWPSGQGGDLTSSGGVTRPTRTRGLSDGRLLLQAFLLLTFCNHPDFPPLSVITRNYAFGHLPALSTFFDHWNTIYSVSSYAGIKVFKCMFLFTFTSLLIFFYVSFASTHMFIYSVLVTFFFSAKKKGNRRLIKESIFGSVPMFDPRSFRQQCDHAVDSCIFSSLTFQVALVCPGKQYNPDCALLPTTSWQPCQCASHH